MFYRQCVSLLLAYLLHIDWLRSPIRAIYNSYINLIASRLSKKTVFVYSTGDSHGNRYAMCCCHSIQSQHFFKGKIRCRLNEVNCLNTYAHTFLSTDSSIIHLRSLILCFESAKMIFSMGYYLSIWNIIWRLSSMKVKSQNEKRKTQKDDFQMAALSVNCIARFSR